ncbi:MAG: class I SAM-dependent methyltransferase [Thermoleophilia bacterium]|nr:class I SAM-dependent methyltransferase [Thermoleophilia bacterium]MDH3725096.1 class I SAM-dependent methyltransferase [Thermoleophilia bacterium]
MDDAAYAERFAIEHAHYECDLEFWIATATRCGSPVLDIGCAVGRVSLALARAGFDVWAIDRSPAMLIVLSSRAERLGLADRISVHAADMRRLELGRRFPLAIIPMNTFQLMHERADQVDALVAVHRHLESDGELLLEVANPDFSAIERSVGALVPAGTHRDEEREVLMLHSSRYDSVDLERRRATFTLRIDERADDGSSAVFVREFDVRLFSPAELRALLEETGFEVLDVYGDFDRTPLTEAADRQLLRCRPAP